MKYFFILFFWLCLAGRGPLHGQTPSSESSGWLLYSSAQVDSEGVFLSQLVAGNPANPPPHLRLAEAPAFGQVLLLTRQQIIALLDQTMPDLDPERWMGSDRVRIVRKARMLGEDEIKQQLSQLLQQEHVKDRGDLELRFLRRWTPVVIPDEPYTLKILDLPSAGVTPHFIARFQIQNGQEIAGTWQAPLQARVWREVYVARTALKSGDPFSLDDVNRERRDVLTFYDAPLESEMPAFALEMAQMVPAGAPIYERSVRLRPVVRRGQVVEARLRDGTMTISLLVEVLENGAPGQLVRLRNLQSKREFRGKVQDEQTVLVAL